MEFVDLTLIPLVLLLVQGVKTVWPSTKSYAVPFVLFFAAMLSPLVVDWSQDWQGVVKEAMTIIVAVASGASGVYSWSAKKDNVEITMRDYTDSV